MKRWGTQDGPLHPDDETLLLLLEGELDSRESNRVTAHVRECWRCRARSERQRRSICAFVEFRDREILPNLPPPRADNQAFAARLVRLERGLPPVGTKAQMRLLLQGVVEVFV